MLRADLADLGSNDVKCEMPCQRVLDGYMGTKADEQGRWIMAHGSWLMDHG